MRTPALHITEQTLVKLISDYFPTSTESENKKLANYLLSRGKTYSLSHRMIYVSNDKMLKKAEKIKVTNSSDAGKFAELLTMYRRKFKHRGINQIKPGDPDWLTLKEVSAQATEFCNEVGLPIKEGYKEYIQIGLGMIKKYSLNKFKSVHSSIINKYDALQELAEDKDPAGTKEVHSMYTRIMDEKTGMSFGNDYKENPEKYVCFKRAKDEATRLKIPVKIYITAQFSAMEWQNRIPDPLQLYGDKAIERVRKYCVENNIKITPEKRINFKAIKDAKNNTGE